ncbi:MAG: nicotinate (nicotinamide) nucleotide adenylyltransferase [Actinomycetota bacterium]
MPSDAQTRPVSLRLGLLGGTFDPPHAGHLAAAETVLGALGLDRVDLLPAHDPWQKSEGGREVTPAEVRLEMVRALVGARPGLGVDDREIRRGGVTYTVDTLLDVRRESPDAEVFLILGADTARRFHTWHRHEEVASLSTLVIVNRDHEDHVVPPGAARVEFVHMTPVDVSSTAVRADVAAGRDVTELVTPGVARIISAEGLYGAAR